MCYVVIIILSHYLIDSYIIFVFKVYYSRNSGVARFIVWGGGHHANAKGLSHSGGVSEGVLPWKIFESRLPQIRFLH